MPRRLTGTPRRLAADRPSKGRAADREASGHSGRAASAAVVLVPDLGATLHLDGVPDGLLAELPALYSSIYSVVEYFRLFNGAISLCACVLDEPRHIVVFERHGHSVTILNQLFDIDERSARRTCEAIFRALPDVRRLRFNGSRLDVTRIGLPARLLALSTDVVIELPDDYDEYFRTLSPAMRRLRSAGRRLKQAYPGYEALRFERNAITSQVVASVLNLSRERMTGKGDTWAYSTSDEARLVRLLQSFGMATLMVVDGKPIAGSLETRVGTECYGHVHGFDGRFAKYSPGLLCTLLEIDECIHVGVRRFHLLWGTSTYKARLGGKPQTLHAVSVYRSRLWRALDAAGVWRQFRSWAKDGPPSRWIVGARAWLGRNVRRRLLPDRDGHDASGASSPSAPPGA
jgi:hypothetical protein